MKAFRIYKTKDEFISNKANYVEIQGQIDFQKACFKAHDGNEYRLNLSKFAVNDPLADLDLSKPSSKVCWLVPQDSHKWQLGYHQNDSSSPIYVYRENDKLYGLSKGQIIVVENIIFDNSKRTYQRCTKYIQNNGIQILNNCFVWETQKSFFHQVNGKKVKFSKMNDPQDSLPVAFIDDQNSEEILGYIFMA